MLKPAVIPDLKWCPRRRHMVSRERFDKNPVRADGLNTWCKDCKREHYQSLIARRLTRSNTSSNSSDFA
jgi:hypothetical protein